MSGIMRLGFVEIAVPDPQSVSPFYKGTLGLEQTGAGPDGTLYLKCWDEHDHHSVVLQRGEKPAVSRVGWKVERDSDLEELEKGIEGFGIPVKRVSPGSHLGEGLSFIAPSGHPMLLYHQMDFVGRSVAAPEIMPPEGSGIAPSHLDHFFGCAEDVPETLRFMTSVLGFHLTEQILDPAGSPAVVFLARTSTPHDIAFAKGPNGKYHHVAFHLDAWEDVRRAAKTLADARHELEVPPSLHGGTRGYTVYFRDPSGNRLETFAGGYQSFADTPTITWTAEHAGRALFYFAGPADLNGFMAPL